jgi:steroid delta-isomerase-like uncharacterized protein
METEKNQVVVHRYIDEFWSEGKVELAEELISPAYTRTDPSTPWVTGDREGVKQVMLSLRSAFPDLHFDTQELIPTGDKVIVRWTATGTHQGELLGIAPSGMSVSIMGTSIYRLSGGQMVDEYTIWDSMGMMQQLGVIPYLA